MQFVMTAARIHDGRMLASGQVIDAPGDVPEDIARVWMDAGDCTAVTPERKENKS
jgi:hypothetical protein